MSPPEQPVWSRLLSQGTLPDSLVDSSQAWHESTVAHKGTPFFYSLLNLDDDIKEKVLSWCQNVFNSSPTIANLPFYQREQALSLESLDGNSIQVKFNMILFSFCLLCLFSSIYYSRRVLVFHLGNNMGFLLK